MRISKLCWSAAMMAGFALAWGGVANAAVIISVVQSGSDVVFTGIGTIDTTDLGPETAGFAIGGMNPSAGSLGVGPAILTPVELFPGVPVLPTDFGAGGGIVATSGTGSIFGATKFQDAIIVPVGYVSGTSLSGTATFANETFATLGLTQGTYVFSWGTQADADTLTIDVGTVTATPEPATLAVFGVPLLVGLLTRRRRARAR